jgi:hypothetical protein
MPHLAKPPEMEALGRAIAQVRAAAAARSVGA